ncbi:hypothetical protein IEQ34_003509 [Dendrobium chrysotoxum]|uniref:WPP domain-associated protein n=1 Tax=Dendrobium chrysotoxum TaxID=161865 RepID=A0AAV7HHU7_DENCH|nr:hypothetical protein IEQ34_003509 [Dendrobium chrysotoxum]
MFNCCHNARLMDGINLLLESLDINKKLLNTDGNEDVFLETVLGEINNLLACISNSNDENQLLHMELSVCHTFLKQNTMEKVILGQELGRMDGQLLVFQRDQDLLFERCAKLGQDVNEKERTNESLKAELESLCSLLSDMSEDFSNLRGEKGALEEENNILLEEAVALEHLYLFFNSSNAQNLQSLKLLEDAIGSCCKSVKKEKHGALETYQKLQCTQVQVTKLCTKLDTANDKVDEAKMMKLQFDEKVAGLLKGHACKDVEIITTHEENRMLNEELNRLNAKIEMLRKREQCMSSELQKKKCELDRCEGEITNLLINIHVSAVNGAVFEEKVFEWAFAYDGLEICALVQREMLIEEISLRNAHAFKLQKKLDDLEKENIELKAIWNSCLPLFIFLEDGIAIVENQAHQLAYLCDDQVEKSNETRIGDLGTIAGALELQNLVSKIGGLEKLMLHINNQLKHERLLYASNLESARREIEELKLVASDKQLKQGKETSGGKDGQLMKDIELDQVSNSLVLSRKQSTESEDQMLKLWETAERDYSNSVSNGHGIEGVQDFRCEEHSSEIVAEKEVGVDKLEMSTEMKKSTVEWKRSVIERLSTGAEKLSALKTTAHELRAKVEISGKRERRKCSEHNAMQTKLKQAEEGILSLVDTDDKLRKKLEESLNLSNGEKTEWLDKRQVWEQVLIVMDQIEKLELEMQEIHYFFAKFDEEVESKRTQEGDRTPQVLLRDYIKGWRVGQGRKRGRICGCIRPKTQE